MQLSSPKVPGLTSAGCRARQQRLAAVVRSHNLAGALITDRRHVHYFTGFWGREIHSPAVWIDRQGRVTLALPGKPLAAINADEVVIYASNDYCTLVDDQRGAALAALQPCWKAGDRIGVDQALWPAELAQAAAVDLLPAIRLMRRCKDDDEVALIAFALNVSEVGYELIRSLLRPGLDELGMWAQLQTLFASLIGETPGELGNDFQVGSLGNAPRQREMKQGEAAIIDLGVVVRGYNGDMCRTFIVGGHPSAEQIAAHARIMESLAFIEATVKPGLSCRSLFQEVQKMLHGHGGCAFEHHLGHGIGLAPHESPRLNPMHDDHFAIGDLFTCEPGLYAPALRVGIRVEQAYHLSENGLIRLTPSSTDL